MKVLWYSVSPHVKSGYGIQCKGVVSQLIQKGFEVDVNSFSGLTNGDVTLQLNGQQIKIYGGSGNIFDKQLSDRAKQYDVVCTHMDQWLIANKLSKINTPMIHWTIMDQIPPPKPLQKLINFDNVKGIVPMSYWAKHEMTKYDKHKTVTDPIYHGVDLDLFRPDRNDLDENYKKMVKQTDFLVGMINTNTLRELIPNNIEAFAMFAQRHPDKDIRLYVNSKLYRSDGYNLQTIAQYILNKYNLDVKQIMFRRPNKGPLSDKELASLYCAMDVNLATTMGDSFGIPIIEAGACGTPSIVTDFSAPKELVEGRGIVVPTYTDIWMQRTNSKQRIPRKENIANALDEYYNNKKKRLKYGNKMQQWVKKNCNWNIIGDKWAKLLNKVIL